MNYADSSMAQIAAIDVPDQRDVHIETLGNTSVRPGHFQQQGHVAVRHHNGAFTQFGP